MPDAKKIDKIRSSKPFSFWDAIVFGIVIAAVIFLFIFSFSGGGDYVRVSYGGSVNEYPLYIDNVIEIDGKLIIVIKDGGVSVEDSTCPDKVCEYSGVIKRRNQMIICVPHDVVITIISVENDWI